MSEREAVAQREGLSLQTLVIAAVASAVAAVVVSHVWKSGTVIAAAMTPVIVSVVKEALRRPIQSDIVRRSASRVSDVATARRALAGTAAARTESARRQSPARGAVPPPPQRPHYGNGTNGDLTPGDVLLTHPRRTYSAGNGARGGRLARLNGRHLKIAVITGLLAFVVAAVFVTVPELVFGGAVTSSHSTTFFGGGSSKSDKQQKSDKQNNGSHGGSSTQQQQPQSQGSQPAQPAPSQPTQTTPQQTPAPQQPSPSQQQAPPSSGGASPAPSAPSPSTP